MEESFAETKLSNWFRQKTSIGLWREVYCTFYKGTLQIFRNDKADSVADKYYIITPDTEVIFDEEELQITVKNSSYQFSLFSDTIDIIKKWTNSIRASTFTDHMSISSFQIISVLGRGYYGKVMLCRHIGTEKLYAIKSVRKSFLCKENQVQTVLCERNILVKARYPFITPLYYAFQTPCKFYLVLEYEPGGELFNRIFENEEPIDSHDLKFYIAEIALALHYLHGLGIIYRDLKPENILLGANGHLHLADFGLSKELKQDLQIAESFCGTAQYIAPEAIKHLPYSFKVDWWSLGVIIYEMIVGTLPFLENDQKKLYHSITSSEPNYFFITDDQVELLRGLMNKDPSKRWGFDEIKECRFMSSINWEQVEKLNVQPHYIPHILNDTSTECFDSEYTDETATDSSATPVESSLFSNFSYGEDEKIEEIDMPSTSILLPPSDIHSLSD